MKLIHTCVFLYVLLAVYAFHGETEETTYIYTGNTTQLQENFVELQNIETGEKIYFPEKMFTNINKDEKIIIKMKYDINNINGKMEVCEGRV